MAWPPSHCPSIVVVTSFIGADTNYLASMANGSRTAECDLVQGERERHSAKRDQRQNPEGVHVGQERRLRLHLLSDPVDGLLVCLGQRAAMGGEIAPHLL